MGIFQYNSNKPTVVKIKCMTAKKGVTLQPLIGAVSRNSRWRRLSNSSGLVIEIQSFLSFRSHTETFPYKSQIFFTWRNGCAVWQRACVGTVASMFAVRSNWGGIVILNFSRCFLKLLCWFMRSDIKGCLSFHWTAAGRFSCCVETPGSRGHWLFSNKVARQIQINIKI